jgi:hypothetical protein
MIIEVSGGPYDGVVVDSDSKDSRDRVLAAVFFRWADETRVGQSFYTLSPASIASVNDPSVKDGSLQSHKYTLTSFSTALDKKVARFEYQGHEQPGGGPSPSAG